MAEAPSGKLFQQSEAEDALRERDPETGRFTKPNISAGLMRQAKALGLDDQDLDGLDADDIRGMVNEERFAKRFERVWQPQQDKSANLRDSPPDPEKKPFSFGPVEDSLDETFVGALRGIVARLEAVEKVTSDLPEFKGHVAAQAKQQSESFGRKVEKAFSKHPEIFGTGSIDKLDRDSPEFHLRMAAVAAHKKAGASLDDLEGDIDSFVKSRFAKSEEPADELSEVEKWEKGLSGNGVLGRPTQRGRTEEPPGREKAVKEIQARTPRLNGQPRPERGSYLRPQG